MARRSGGGIAGRIHLHGAEQLLASLRSFEPKLAKKVLRNAMREAARPILEEAKRLVPVDTGELRDSLVIRAAKRVRKGSVGVVVQTERGFFKGDTYYGAFVEFGTKNMAARPYLRPAFDSRKEEAAMVAQQLIASGIEDIAFNLPKLRKLKDL